MTHEYVDEIKQFISGFTPATTGGLCDLCNTGLSQGDTVEVYAEKYEDEWALKRTHCDDCAPQELDDRELTEAVVRCELGPVLGGGGRVFPLYNPEVTELNTESGPEVRARSG